MISSSWEIWQHKWCQRVNSHWTSGMTFLSPCSSIHARSLPTKRPCRCCWEKQQRLFAAREELLRFWPFCSNSSTILGKLWTEKIIMGREFEKWCRESCQHIINYNWLNVILAKSSRGYRYNVNIVIDAHKKMVYFSSKPINYQQFYLFPAI